MIIPDDHVTTREVTSWQGLHLLHFQSSSCSQKVRVLLREKALDWVSHSVDLPTQKHVSAWYLGINPRGVVPALVHDGVVHVESNDIMEHLDTLPSQAAPFFPQTEAERAWVKANLARAITAAVWSGIGSACRTNRGCRSLRSSTWSRPARERNSARSTPTERSTMPTRLG